MCKFAPFADHFLVRGPLSRVSFSNKQSSEHKGLVGAEDGTSGDPPYESS
jgi:hypothetical protein